MYQVPPTILCEGLACENTEARIMKRREGINTSRATDLSTATSTKVTPYSLLLGLGALTDSSLTHYEKKTYELHQHPIVATPTLTQMNIPPAQLFQAGCT